MVSKFLRCACTDPHHDSHRRCAVCGQMAIVDRAAVARMVGQKIDWSRCSSWIYCTHANECPNKCPCDVTCICRIEGSCIPEMLQELEAWKDQKFPYDQFDSRTDLIDAPRPSWDEIWMEMAHLLSRRSIDPRTKVGCLIVSDDNTQVLAVGYNGNYRGGPNVVESLEPGKSGTIHSETNALIKCDYNNPKRKVMYVTCSPCSACAKLIINGGIAEVVYDVEYRDPTGLDILRSACVKVKKYVRDRF